MAFLYIIFISAFFGVISAREVFSIQGIFGSLPRFLLKRKLQLFSKLLLCPVCLAGWFALFRGIRAGFIGFQILDLMLCSMIAAALINRLIYGR